MSYDVVIVGAGTAGLVCGGDPRRRGKRVAVLEKHPYLGGRAMEHRYRGHQIGLSSHLVEDPGDSLTRACELVGVELTHSERSDSMPFWDDEHGHWIPIQDRYSGAAKQGLKRCIEAVKELSFEDIDNLDHLSLREWMSQYTSDEGVYEVWEAISVLEQITLEPWEHSASENLFIRKLHYERKRTAGYSFWPMGGWESLWTRMADAIRARGGDVIARATVDEVVVRDGAVKGVRLANGEEIEADEVVVNAPVWDLNAAVRRRRPAVGLPQPGQDARGQPEPGVLVRLLDRRRGAGDRLLHAGDGVVLHDPARRPARVHAVLHRL